MLDFYITFHRSVLAVFVYINSLSSLCFCCLLYYILRTRLSKTESTYIYELRLTFRISIKKTRVLRLCLL